MDPSGSKPIALTGVDWGTSSFRLFLFSDEGEIIARSKSRSGITRIVSGGFEAFLDSELTRVNASPETTRVLMSGMIGSNMGWLDAGYVACPASLVDIAGSVIRVPSQKLDVSIVPGLRCDSPLGEPDVMRGEETQVLGLLADEGEEGISESLLCLPGTHTKWAGVSDGKVNGFNTCFTGELFEMLCGHSVLVSGDQQSDDGAFDEGARLGLKSPAISQTLFSARSRALTGSMPASSASAFLSGLLIGSDARSALDLWNPPGAVTVIGDSEIGRLYCRVLHQFSVETRFRDGMQMAASGLWSIHSVL